MPDILTAPLKLVNDAIDEATPTRAKKFCCTYPIVANPFKFILLKNAGLKIILLVGGMMPLLINGRLK
jgi:hypothetical protein